jgi:hypothetical protein
MEERGPVGGEFFRKIIDILTTVSYTYKVKIWAVLAYGRGARGWRSSTVERLICNQGVAGSSPIASSSEAIFFVWRGTRVAKGDGL